MASTYKSLFSLFLSFLVVSLFLQNRRHFVKGEQTIEAEKRVLAGTSGLYANVVVAKDGSGNYRTIKEAVERAPSNSPRRYVIYIKAGLYHENVVVEAHKLDLVFVGDGRSRTVLISNRSYPQYSIQDSGALVVLGNGFVGRDMTFRNTAGPKDGPAVAMRNDADRSAFYRCSFVGYQDTLLANINRQFYKDCDIVGTIDFIFGYASAVFQGCNVLARKPLPGQGNVILAQGKREWNAPGGFVLQNCRIAAFEDLGSTKSHLGRPWHKFSTSIIMQTVIDGFIHPGGFVDIMDGIGNERTATFREYKNTGKGADTRNRVKWAGYKVIYNLDEARQYTVANFINGNDWLPALGIPYKAGLEKNKKKMASTNYSFFNHFLSFLLHLLLLSDLSHFVNGERNIPRALAGTSGLTANAVVAQDGNGNYKSISEAVNQAPSNSPSRYVIYIKAGTYAENVLVDLQKKNLAFVGDGIGKTILTSSRSHPSYSILESGALVVRGDGFSAQYMTFENTAGPSPGPAVAMRNDADRSAFYRCSFVGFQDTLFANKNRQLYKECDVVGTIDFIFGEAAVVFQDCNILPRKPLFGQANAIIAQGKEANAAPGGIVLQKCRISAFEDLGSTQSYLGRPWHKYSTAIIMETTIDGLIDPAGFVEFPGSAANEETATLREYANNGEGSDTRNRVKWAGYRVIDDAGEAQQYTVANFINGNDWLPALGIPYNGGL
ncbi:hypothetical protein H6P81_019746 [Aristolochia fimbriata]|uniref:Pectinesterase n=1 Tax=Aristolochia fimbriata TaxID=158543 RepID=A0AAV7DTU8_ARIFI|nr:hypothetical protein H6P81_019746 [Aristolochia fimbriata]